jgi:tape measure domain-containing protein
VADGDVSLRYRLLGSDEGASRTFDKVGKSSDHLSTRMVAVGTAIGHLAAGGIIALGGMAAGAVKTGIQTAAAMQQAQLGFATLLGSEKAAGAYMKWLTGFAASTPFEMKGLVESSRTLIGVGVSAKDAKVMLQNFGDTASAVGIDQDAFQRVMLATSQAISAGKFQAGDLNQIMTNGIPVWTILSKAMHKSVPELRDLASHGKLLASDVLPALQAEMHKDYGGAMAKQSQTLNGLWSTFQDTLHLGMANVLQPLIPILQSILPGAMDALGKAFTAVAGGAKDFIAGITGVGIPIANSHSALMNLGMGIRALVAAFKDGDVTSDGFVGAMERLGAATRKVFDGLKAAVQGVHDVIVPTFQYIQDHSTIFGSLSLSLASFLATLKLIAIATDLWNARLKVAIALQTALDVVLTANPIGLIVAALAALAVGLIYAYQHSETFRNIVNGVWASVQGVVLVAVGAIQAAWSGLTASLSVVIGWFQALPGRIMSGVVSLPGLFLGLLKSMFEKAAFAVGFSLGMLYNLFFVWPSKVGQAVASLPGIVAHWITTTGVQSVIAFYSFQVTLMARAYALTGELIAWVAALVPRVVAWFERLPGMAVAAIRALPGLIKGVFSAAGTWLLDAGKQVVMGLVNGIKGAAGNAMAAVKDLAGNVVGGFKSALSINSPSKVMADQVGVSIPEGIALGMNDGAHHIATAAARMVPTTPGAYGVGATGGVSGGGNHYHLHIPTGFVGSPRELAVAFSEVLQRAKSQGIPLNV